MSHLYGEALDALKVWRDEMEAAAVRAQHPLNPTSPRHVQRTPSQLLMGGRVYAKETRPQSRSKPPIRDMKPRAEEVNDWVRFIRNEIQDGERYARALELYTEGHSYEEIGKRMNVSRKTARQFFECGIVALQVKIAG